MSQENVELHYRCVDAINRRDLGAFLALWLTFPTRDEALDAASLSE
jgi:hypothetical protein